MKRCIIFVGLLLCVAHIYAIDLQSALKETAKQFSGSLRPNSVVAIIGIYSENSELSDFMMDELALQFIKLKTLTIADRVNLEAIKKEMSFQLSGEVGDESIQQLGAKIGAETVVQGVLKQFGGLYNLTIRALNVTTAAISDMYRTNVELGEMEMSILGISSQKAKTKKVSTARMQTTKKASIKSTSAVKIGLQNLIFGLGSYKNGHVGDGAFLTISHLAGWSLLFSGIGVMVASPVVDPNAYSRAIGGLPAELHPNYSHDKAIAEKWETLGIGLISAGAIVEGIAIIYGAVVPYFYGSSKVIAYGNNSGLKFDVALTPKGNIAPQVSYVLRF